MCWFEVVFITESCRRRCTLERDDTSNDMRIIFALFQGNMNHLLIFIHKHFVLCLHIFSFLIFCHTKFNQVCTLQNKTKCSESKWWFIWLVGSSHDFLSKQNWSCFSQSQQTPTKNLYILDRKKRNKKSVLDANRPFDCYREDGRTMRLFTKRPVEKL